MSERISGRLTEPVPATARSQADFANPAIIGLCHAAQKTSREVQ
jgi:hypothetical protein